MTPGSLPRSWLYVPATRPELVPKAHASSADAVVIDLEDAVLTSAKDRARRALADLAALPRNKPLWVRTNEATSDLGQADFVAVEALPIDGVRLPKCENPKVVAAAAECLHRPVHLLIETAVGVENIDALARCSPWVRGMALGEVDLLADLGGLDATALTYARGRIVTVARAAGLPQPVMSVWVGIGDPDGLRTDTRAARAAGFFGRSVIHPSQLSAVNEVFTPTADEVDHAQSIIDSMREAEQIGKGAYVNGAGEFLDAAVVKRAHLVLARAAATGAIS